MKLYSNMKKNQTSNFYLQIYTISNHYYIMYKVGKINKLGGSLIYFERQVKKFCFALKNEWQN